MPFFSYIECTLHDQGTAQHVPERPSRELMSFKSPARKNLTLPRSRSSSTFRKLSWSSVTPLHTASGRHLFTPGVQGFQGRGENCKTVPHFPLQGVHYTGSGTTLPSAQSTLHRFRYHTFQCTEYITQVQVSHFPVHSIHYTGSGTTLPSAVSTLHRLRYHTVQCT